MQCIVYIYNSVHLAKRNIDVLTLCVYNTEGFFIERIGRNNGFTFCEQA